MSDEASERGSLSTAHATWDQRWTNAAGRADWLAPEPEVVQAVDLLKMRGAQRAFDLGCGVGRHARLLAGAGFEVHAADASASGLAYARAQDPGSAICWARSDFTVLPFAPAVFDFALAWNVIYHGDRVIVARALA
ncbi:MAG: class I SAM-dependent methyltransferase, partial [Sulfuricaulis sp.]|uniref:class I SAM-dependent methyltransferase n=1 Tax=Sulfuricaulis sp. TaxID=2003553 RepID=UPI003C3CA21A